MFLFARYENEAGESSWTAPLADAGGEEEAEVVDGRKLKRGWKRCSDDEGDVVSPRAATGAGAASERC